MNKGNYLIIGGGVGGSSLAIHLINAGINVTLIDQGRNKSSIVAAGLINPLVFRRMTKSWRVDELLPYLLSFYKDLEQQTGFTFFHPITIRRFFSSEQERTFWKDKEELPEYSSYMTKISSDDLNYSQFETKNEFGSGRVKNSAWVNTPIFLEAAHQFISVKGKLIIQDFDYSGLDPKNGVYQSLTYDRIIFAEGYQSRNNPWFEYLPVQSTKGEVLTAESTGLPTTESINRKCFVLPTGKNQYRIGATYSWNAEEANITEEGRQEILEKLRYLTDDQPVITDHLAGIRPTSPDRRPIMGVHPGYDKLFIFNGLGTKGYMIAPLLAKEFTAFLIEGRELHPEVDLKRFKK